MQNDFYSSIKKISNFLGKSYSSEEINMLVKHLSFDVFKSNRFVNGYEMKQIKILNDKEEFIRKGKINGKDDELSPQLEKKINKWISNNLRNSNINFPKF